MTFNQWCAEKRIFKTPVRISLEAIWNALIEAGKEPKEVRRLFNDLVEGLWERA